MNRSEPSLRFRPRVEALEDRTVPAGNLNALVFDGVLYLGGDNAGNQFRVEGAGPESVRISGIDDTTINGKASESLTGIRKGIHFVGGSGADVIEIANFAARDTINLFAGNGNGNETIRLSNVRAGKGGIIVTGDGDDSLSVTGGSFGSLFSVSMHGGNDFVSIANTASSSYVLVNGGSGENVFASSGNRIGDGVTSRGVAPGSTPPPPSRGPTTQNPETPAPAPAPTVQLTTTAPATSNLRSLPFRAEFSSEVTGFSASQITVTNGTVQNFLPQSASVYTFDVVPTGSGAVTVSTAAGAAQSPGGVGSDPSSPVSVTVDLAAPQATINTPSAEPTFAATIPFTVTFDKPVTGVTQSSFTATNGTVSSLTPLSGTSFRVNVTPTADGAVTLSLAAGQATDGVGNSNALTTGSATSIRTAAGLPGTRPNVMDPSFLSVGAQGLKIRDLQVGSGTRTVGPTGSVDVFYRGFLNSDGSIFDSSVTTGAPANFPLNSLIAGFTQGVQGMRIGGVRQIFIPAALGYGSMPRPGIPANSDLVFEVKLLGIG